MSVEAQIRELIKKNSEIDMATFMEVAMSLSSDAYYKATQPLGEGGDFTTAPEISQMFGEIIGMWVYDVWQKLGSPEKINLVEIGPGRGVLMRDLLNGTSQAKDFARALNIYLIDINPRLKKIQRENLAKFTIPINWLENLSDLPERHTIFIANEFFDALAIHQYVKEKNHWAENVVAIKHDNNQLFFKRKPLVQDFSNQLNIDHPNCADGSVIEESREGIRWMQEIAEHMLKHKGAALIVDYGYDIDPKDRKSSQYNSTLQGVKNHKYHPILENIGATDLSSHVDFYMLKKIAKARNIQVIGAITQAEFLKYFGIDTRLKLLKQQNPDLAMVLDKQYYRLVSEKQMGSLFKVCMFNSC
jgi:NADH dehydrogenase [ubiquinone] 1 alpha subcomplex assembly factor 7